MEAKAAPRRAPGSATRRADARGRRTALCARSVHALIAPFSLGAARTPTTRPAEPSCNLPLAPRPLPSCLTPPDPNTDDPSDVAARLDQAHRDAVAIKRASDLRIPPEAAAGQASSLEASEGEAGGMG